MTNDPARDSLTRLLVCLLPPQQAAELTDTLFNTYGTLSGILENAFLDTRVKLPKPAHLILSMVPELCEMMLLEQTDDHPLLNTLSRTGEYVRRRFINVPYERVMVLCLDQEFRLKECRAAIDGGIHDVPFYPRRLLQEITSMNAHAAVLCHNHPSDWSFFSEADVQATRELLELCAQIRFPLIDHLLVCDDQVMSMRSRSYISEELWKSCSLSGVSLKGWRSDLPSAQEYFTDPV